MESVGISSFYYKYSGFGYVYWKFDALDKFFEFKAKSNNLSSVHIKSLRLDQGGMLNKFDSFHRST